MPIVNLNLNAYLGLHRGLIRHFYFAKGRVIAYKEEYITLMD